MNKKSLLSLLYVVLLTGCASQYGYKAGPDSALLTIAGNSKQFFVEAHKDRSCAVDDHGIRVATFHGPTSNVADHEQGTTLAVPPGKELLLTFHYIDARYALNRMCDIMVGVTPESNRKYKAYFSVKPDVSGCAVEMKQERNGVEEEVPTFVLAEHVCLTGRNAGPIQGRGQRLHWRAEIMTLPAK